MSFRSYPRVYYDLILVSAMLIMGMGLLSSFLSIFSEGLDPSGILAGIVISAWFLLGMFIDLPGGIISDRVWRSRLLLIGLSTSFCGSLLCALTNSIYVLIIGRILWGLGSALYFMNSTALILDLFDSRIIGRVLGTFQSIEFLGTFIGKPLGAFMADSLGNSYLPVFYASASLTFVSFFLAFISRNLKRIEDVKKLNQNMPIKEAILEVKNWAVLVVCINSFSWMLIM